MRRSILLLVTLAVAGPAVAPAAQPSADALVGTWLGRQAAASRGVVRVEADEALSRRIEGPRGTVRLDTRGTLTLGPDARRTVTSARVDDQEVAVERVAELEERLGRAFGPGFGDASRGPSLVPRALARGTARRVTTDAVDGRPAWRVTLDPAARPPRRGPRRGRDPEGGRPPGPERAEAWFSRSADAPRLLRVETSGRRPGGGVLRRTVDFAPAGGLDVPEAATADLRVTQRRRLRGYTTAITVSARYSGVTVVRR